ncbi:hypothetical protein, partial [Commensalibacter communis]|uniref:hypothetical protein n=1 Tax=Commensalibacter communis TaxID=2972786 RepID=UPI002330A461
IANNANRIFGYDWGANADNVRWAQGLLAGDESMQGILNSFAYGGETYNTIANNANRIFGYDWGANADNVRWAQGLLAG